MNSTPLNIIRLCRLSPVPHKKLIRTANLLYRKERLASFQKISLVFCSDRKIRTLNTRFRKIDRPTDVLSFTLGDSDLLGEVYISVERARVQARRYHVSCNDEIIRLFVHGFYHLLGYDHKTARQRTVMEKKESSALNSFIK
jgi:probable rRNA maturation factor